MHLYVSLPCCLSVRLSVCLSVCLSLFIYLCISLSPSLSLQPDSQRFSAQPLTHGVNPPLHHPNLSLSHSSGLALMTGYYRFLFFVSLAGKSQSPQVQEKRGPIIQTRKVRSSSTPTAHSTPMSTESTNPYTLSPETSPRPRDYPTGIRMTDNPSYGLWKPAGKESPGNVKEGPFLGPGHDDVVRKSVPRQATSAECEYLDLK